MNLFTIHLSVNLSTINLLSIPVMCLIIYLTVDLAIVLTVIISKNCSIIQENLKLHESNFSADNYYSCVAFDNACWIKLVSSSKEVLSLYNYCIRKTQRISLQKKLNIFLDKVLNRLL